MSHSNEHSGLQEHSVGDDYPWSIVVYKQPRGVGYCQAKNLITGETRGRLWFGPNDRLFIEAHRLAEASIPRDTGKYVEGMRELAELGYPFTPCPNCQGTNAECTGQCNA
jgi:hypothetical protein